MPETTRVLFQEILLSRLGVIRQYLRKQARGQERLHKEAILQQQEKYSEKHDKQILLQQSFFTFFYNIIYIR